jgi:ubiquinol-cytochrome c reductase cytochrome c subunit
VTDIHDRPARTARRRRSLPASLVVLFALVTAGGLWSALAPGSRAAVDEDASIAARQGRVLFLQGCSSCHGLAGQGTNLAPSLIGVGAAAVDFQVSTGRMPLAAPGAQADRHDPAYNPEQIAQLVAYAAAEFGGPEVPRVDINAGDVSLARGGELFRANCAQCHQAAGAGAPLTYGKYAPALDQASPVEVVEAMRTGPENMPVFGPAQLNEQQATDIAAYVNYLQKADQPGGHGLGGYGPVPEGLVAWVIGIGGLVGATLWIGARQA